MASAPLLSRVNRACDRCRRNKSRCDPYRPCSLCKRSGVSCLLEGAAFGPAPSHGETAADSSQTVTADERKSHKRRRTAESPSPGQALGEDSARTTAPPSRDDEPHADTRGDSAITIAKTIYRLESRTLDEGALSAIPGAGARNDRSNGRDHGRAKLVPISSLLAHPLPPEGEVLSLLEDYFHYVHWFSLVILEPKFRPAFLALKDGFAKPSSKPFLLLLSTMLGLAAWYRSARYVDDACEYWRDCSRKLLDNAEQQITHLLEQSSMLSIQILTLLGSFYVYHGRPSLSFSLLGATIKAAQAAGLHQESKQIAWLDAEQRRRVWWTIYTWDRFSSITYGRPLGINDKDCNVAMPSLVEEDIFFAPRATSDPHPSKRISYSAYQHSLNELYLIASPAIESLYSARENQSAANEYLILLGKITKDLWRWRQDLPTQLSLNLDRDCLPQLGETDRVYRLQGLSLHLTFESLQIILHRPFLKRHLKAMWPQGTHGSSRIDGENISTATTFADTTAGGELDTLDSQHQWWEAAVRTARTTESLNLVNQAIETHLVSFFALNLFNAAIVMVVLALSDPLHDRAQQAKRAVTGIYHLQKSLGPRSVLSQQSSQVIYKLVELLLRREREAILEPPAVVPTRDILGRDIPPGRERSAHQSKSHQAPIDNGLAPDWNASSVGQHAMASRLDSSLESVQRIFSSGPQLQRQELAGPINVQQYHAVNSMMTPDLNEDQNLGITGSWKSSMSPTDWNNVNFNISDGVGWFWDPAWDDLEAPG